MAAPPPQIVEIRDWGLAPQFWASGGDFRMPVVAKRQRIRSHWPLTYNSSTEVVVWDYSKDAIWSVRSYPTRRAERVLACLREGKFPDCPVAIRKSNHSSGFACGEDRYWLYLDRAHEDNPWPALEKLDNAWRGNTLEISGGQRAGHFPLTFWIAEIKGWKRKGGNVLLETDPGWEGGLGKTASPPLSPCNVSNVRKLHNFQSGSQTPGKTRTLRWKRTELHVLGSLCYRHQSMSSIFSQRPSLTF